MATARRVRMLLPHVVREICLSCDRAAFCVHGCRDVRARVIVYLPFCGGIVFGVDMCACVCV